MDEEQILRAILAGKNENLWYEVTENRFRDEDIIDDSDDASIGIASNNADAHTSFLSIREYDPNFIVNESDLESQLDSISCQYGVVLSVENSSNSYYEGYLWSNNKMVFMTPLLKASVVKGVSKSEKICGFEVRGHTSESVPFTVYLLDELSGVGEMQVKYVNEFDNQLKPFYEFNVEAFDCDSLPHYSHGALVRIHVDNESGPIFYKKSYTFSVKKDAKMNSLIGTVTAKSLADNPVEYSIQHDEKLPFQINQSGVISLRDSLISTKQSDFLIRVVVKEINKGIPKQSLALVNIEIEPVCQNKLTDFPDQLDYYIKNGITNMMESGQLIQQGHRPILTMCNLPSPLKEVTLRISLKPHSLIDKNYSFKEELCPTDIPANRIQRAICGANPDTIDLLLTEGGIIHINEGGSIGPDTIKSLGTDFTLSWWMKRQSKLKTEIFCFKDEQTSLSISFKNCQLTIVHDFERIEIKIPSSKCQIHKWQFFTITQQWIIMSTLSISVDGSLLTTVTRESNLFQFQTVNLFVGHCFPIKSPVVTQSGSRTKSHLAKLGVISLATGRPQVQDAIECLSTCGEVIVTSESIAALTKVNVERNGSSLVLKSTSIIQLLDSPTKIHYVNNYYSLRTDNIKAFEPSDILIDLSIECESKEIISVPRAVMRINFIGPQREAGNDTIDVEIVSNSTITATRSDSIRIFPNLRFISGNTEINTDSIAKNLKLETCVIRLFQRNLVANEKIYLPTSLLAILNATQLEIKSDLFQWAIEGEANGEIYENILRHVQVDMIDERKKFSIICTLKGGDYTSQTIVEVIQTKFRIIHLANEEDSSNGLVHQQSRNERAKLQEKSLDESSNQLNITKSKFIGVIIMAVFGGAAWALVTAAITCFVIRKRQTTNDRKKYNNSKNYSKTDDPNNQQPSLMNTRDVFIDYEFEEDRTSMADIPDDEEQNLDNISCETCNMTDPDVIVTSSKSIKDIPRSKTITFPIIHRKF